jgi:ADP-ribose pyrophosphatase
MGYIDGLPPAARYRGSADAGEIELIDPASQPNETAFGVVYEDPWVRLVRDPVRFPDGHVDSYLRVLERTGPDGRAGVVVIPADSSGCVFIRVFRHAVRRWETELPRGFFEGLESSQEAALRELREETGLTGSGARELGTVSPNTGILGSDVAVILVDPPNTRGARGELREAVARVDMVPWAEVVDRIRRGDIRDGISLAALSMLAAAEGDAPDGWRTAIG